MALPKIQQPLFDYTLPISKIDITYRAFLVGEEKILLIGKEADAKAQVKAMEQVLTNVIVEPKDLDVTSLTTVDVEMLFIQLRSKSVQNVVELKYRDTEDQKTYNFNVDLDELEPVIDPDREFRIQLDENLGIELKDPTLATMTKLGLAIQDEPSSEDILKLVASCIVSVWDDKEVYDDFTHEEAVEFLANMDVKRFEKISEFYNSAPKIEKELNYTNSEGNKRTITLNGLSDFF